VFSEEDDFITITGLVDYHPSNSVSAQEVYEIYLCLQLTVPK